MYCLWSGRGLIISYTVHRGSGDSLQYKSVWNFVTLVAKVSKSIFRRVLLSRGGQTLGVGGPSIA